ncbi:MAG: hypothetical protein GQ574_17845 [Crocinitomix sp.]|nr:hypothetical protein [Crocinitomix sp.]
MKLIIGFIFNGVEEGFQLLLNSGVKGLDLSSFGRFEDVGGVFKIIELGMLHSV